RLVVALARGEVHARHAALADEVQHADAGNLDLRADALTFEARRELGGEGLLGGVAGEVAQRRNQPLAGQLLLSLVVVGARLHRLHGDHLVAGAGQEQDLRAVGAALELGEPLETVAVLAPEHVIEDQDVVAPERELGPGDRLQLGVVVVDDRVRPLGGYVVRQQRVQVLVVVDDEDAHRYSLTEYTPTASDLPRSATSPRACTRSAGSSGRMESYSAADTSTSSACAICIRRAAVFTVSPMMV